MITLTPELERLARRLRSLREDAELGSVYTLERVLREALQAAIADAEQAIPGPAND